MQMHPFRYEDAESWLMSAAPARLRERNEGRHAAFASRRDNRELRKVGVLLIAFGFFGPMPELPPITTAVAREAQVRVGWERPRSAVVMVPPMGEINAGLRVVGLKTGIEPWFGASGSTRGPGG